jgi:hypothetical protein
VDVLERAHVPLAVGATLSALTVDAEVDDAEDGVV